MSTSSETLTAKVITWTKVKADDPNLADVVEATIDYVGTLPVVAALPEGSDWPNGVNLGATMLAARLLRRRNSPNGVEGMTTDAISYVARYDSDIARLLKLDGFQGPAVG